VSALSGLNVEASPRSVDLTASTSARIKIAFSSSWGLKPGIYDVTLLAKGDDTIKEKVFTVIVREEKLFTAIVRFEELEFESLRKELEKLKSEYEKLKMTMQLYSLTTRDCRATTSTSSILTSSFSRISTRLRASMKTLSATTTIWRPLIGACRALTSGSRANSKRPAH